jgi:hypothetical protein
VGRFLFRQKLIFELLRDFGLFSGTDNFVNRLGAHFEQPGYLCDRMAICICVTVRLVAVWAGLYFSAVSLPAVQRLRVVQWPG